MKKIIIAVAIVSTLFMSATVVLSQINFAPTFTDDVEVEYTTREINSVLIEQEDFHTYDVEITFHNEGVAYDDVAIHIAKLQDETSEDTLLNMSHSGNGVYTLDDFSIDSRGDHYITIFYQENGQQKQSNLPITFPIMQPKIYINQGLNNLMFEIDGDTSWSSFIDPEGINLYRSSDYVFNENATLIAENLVITEWQYLDAFSTDEQPYYFIELNSKEGRVTFRTSALFGEVTQTAFHARFVTTFEGETILELTGNIHGPRSGEATRDIQLRVGNYPATTMIPNESTEDDSTHFKFSIDVEDLLVEGNNDLVLFYTENGTMLEAPINALEQNINQVTKSLNGYKYSLSNPSALTIQKRLEITSNNLQAFFTKETNNVTATFSGQAFVHDESNVEGYELTIGGLNTTYTSDMSNGFEFIIDLSDLPPSDAWRDIHLYIIEDGTTYRIDLPADAVSVNTIDVSGVTYQFPSWNNELKLYKE